MTSQLDDVITYPMMLAWNIIILRWHFCFGSLVVFDVVCGYVLLFFLDMKIQNR